MVRANPLKRRSEREASGPLRSVPAQATRERREAYPGADADLVALKSLGFADPFRYARSLMPISDVEPKHRGIAHVGKIAELWRWTYASAAALHGVLDAASRVEGAPGGSVPSDAKRWATGVQRLWLRFKKTLASGEDAKPPWALFRQLAPNREGLLEPLADPELDARRRDALDAITPPLENSVTCTSLRLLDPLVRDLAAWIETWTPDETAEERVAKLEAISVPSTPGITRRGISLDGELSVAIVKALLMLSGTLVLWTPRSELARKRKAWPGRPLHTIAGSAEVEAARKQKKKGSQHAAHVALAVVFGCSASQIQNMSNQ